jgi:hypothetical protein
VFKDRGSNVVTVRYCKRCLPGLRKYSRWTVTRSLHVAGLAWLRRRPKKLVSAAHKETRVKYAKEVLRKTDATLNRHCYVDGSTFYLARGEAEAMDKNRARLGAFVYRMASGKDGLYSDNVGASLYAASQGVALQSYVNHGLGLTVNALARLRHTTILKIILMTWARRC